ncbi:MAG: hypothetical protein ACO32S_05350, partial [Steroidobacteraceae bacterium]
MNTTALTTFIVIAVVFAAAGFFWMLRPLWRDRSERWVFGIAIGVLAVLSIVLYRHASVWTWPDDIAAADDPTTMVSRLARRL